MDLKEQKGGFCNFVRTLIGIDCSVFFLASGEVNVCVKAFTVCKVCLENA